ncbi:FAD/NAD(P)-binding protein [Rhodopseudomonas sp. P2A-2r]|uniref:FAD/NAD(P)-binding protein n=1 Tax=Rhodopseudomonas sp. P2A-2r TaxID=2991972 RepID=UPI002234CA4B|nr:FAD/NAD(P)-binding protein [Rhodopseudomonas sp. P2A-2r]UZE51674.1 FAD/NAD(P)-binding protein [Rhodopseudomonas sp. P2A-2r]
MKISIVGCGATGIAILRHLAELACSGGDRSPVSEIQLFDKSGFDGGMAYRTQSDQHLLNMRVSTMSIRAGDSQDFLRWTSRAGVPCEANDHLPRKVYRDYLEDVRQSAIERCRNVGIRVSVEHAEVVAMHLTPAGDIVLETDHHESYVSSVMVLCTGHNVPGDNYNLAASKNFVPDPYADFSFADRSDLEVGILGSGLTAIDSVLALARSHPSIRITCMSRSGLFPTVQAISKPAADGEFRDALRRYVDGIGRTEADDLASTISRLLYATTGLRCNLSFSNDHADALADLEHNIAQTEARAPNVTSYLTGVVDIVCDAWSKMDHGEKSRFMTYYNSGWLRNRSAMPLANALKVRDLLRTGRLSTRSSLRTVTAIGSRFRATFGTGSSCDMDHVIAATGPSYQLDALPLYADMQRQGLVVLDAHGGIRCDYDDSRVLDERGSKHSNIFAVGSPTKGTHFYAGAVDINLRRAESVIDTILRNAEQLRSRSTGAETAAKLEAVD